MSFRQRLEASIVRRSRSLTNVDYLELRIRILIEEIAFYSKKAAEAKAQGAQNESLEIAAQTRREALTKTTKELNKLRSAEKKKVHQLSHL